MDNQECPAPINRTGASRSRLLIAVVALVLLLCTAVRLAVNNVVDFSNADEQVYLNQVTSLAENHGHYAPMVERYLSDDRTWSYPPPTRYGYIIAGYAFTTLVGDRSRRSLATMNTLASVLLVWLAAAVAWRMGGPWTALVAACLCLASPLSLAMGRRALLEMPAALFTLAALWAFFEAIRDGAPKWLLGLACAALAVNLAVSERGLLTMAGLVPWLAFLAWRDRHVPWKGLTLLAVGGALWIGFFALITGSPTALFRALQTNAAQLASNTYGATYQSGPFYAPIVAFTVLAPLVTLSLPLACYLYLAHPLRFSDAQRGLMLWIIACITLVCLSIALHPSGLVNVRYLLPWDAPLRISLAGALCVLVSQDAQSRWRPFEVTLLVVFLIGNALLEWAVFRQVFLVANVYDPVLHNLLKALQMIP